MKGVIVVLLLLIAAGLVYSIVQKEAEVRRVNAAAVADKTANEAAQIAAQKKQALIDVWRNTVEEAIRDRRVIVGMTKYEVHQSWGAKLEDEYPTDEDRKNGIVEIWRYNGTPNDKGVGFDTNGEVAKIWR